LVVGRATVKYSGTPEPAISISSGGVTVTGLGGASITAVSVNPTNSLNQTTIAFARGGQIWDYNYLTGVATQITSLAGNAGFSGGPSFGKNVAVFATTSPASLYACFYNGQNLIKLNSGTNSVTQRPAYSSAVGYIAGYDAAGDLVVEGAGGGAGTILVPHASLDVVGSVGWLGTAQTVVFQEPVSGTEQLFEIPFTVSGSTITPGTAIRVPNFTNSVSGAYDLQTAVNNTATAVCWNNNASSGQGTLNVTSLTTGSTLNITQPSYNYYDPSFSPDGTSITFIGQDSGTSGNDGSYGVYTSLIDGENPYLIASDPSGTGGPLTDTSSFTSWMPFPGSANLVGGSGAAFGSSVSGFLQSQVGDAMSSFLTYTASPASSVVVTAAGTSSSSSSTEGALVFTVAATAFSNVQWNNGYGLPIPSTQSIATASGTTNLVVSFSGTSGQVLFVAPLTGAGAKTAKSGPVKSGTNYVYSGKFSAIYDGTGKNIAPSGASQLQVDQKTGKLVNFS
jgi:hypothetical protein